MRRSLAPLMLGHSLAFPQACEARSSSEPRFLLACVPCHGFDGMGHDGNVPNLAGPDRQYLHSQLIAFRSGPRNYPVMSFFSAQMTPDELT
jgi:cytochrome c553